MSFSKQIDEDLKKAMRDKDKPKLETLRAVKTAFTLARSEKGAGSVLDENEEMKIMQKLVKQRRDSAKIYREQNREDLALNEEFEANVVESYLPEQLNEEELEVAVRGIIEKTGAESMKDMGKVMGIATKELAGKAEAGDGPRTGCGGLFEGDDG